MLIKDANGPRRLSCRLQRHGNQSQLVLVAEELELFCFGISVSLPPIVMRSKLFAEVRWQRSKIWQREGIHLLVVLSLECSGTLATVEGGPAAKDLEMNSHEPAWRGVATVASLKGARD